ncbi:hypothetical protein HOD20_10205 [archaeon]|jgi:hypothetical protein|nr:hypothetical protein [archaeon]MBT4352882.1 hypothetical protein [archaeon]MBT4647435.1 hypothetical protein [archaeon]MBT6821289.1 hypothetical protein [archaeon]MBT7391360.1 hypothetical protein [archaeon]
MDKIIFHKKFEKIMPILTLMILAGVIISISPQFFDLRQKITGFATLNTTVVILNITPNACNTTFESGWNLISIPCYDPTNDSIDLIFDSIDGSYRSIHSYEGDASTDPWKAYNPNLPSWVVQDLSGIDRKKGYWVYMDQNDSYFYNGITVDPNLISLSTGWNLIGYPTFENRSIEVSTSSIEPDFEYFYLYNASDPTDKYKQYTWNGSLPSPQDLNSTVPYYGYWVYMYSPNTWVIT